MSPTRSLGAVQGLRALAIILVVLHHANLGVPGGFLGVDVFFVISGFVITRLLLTQTASGSLSLVTFYLRRARRIIPALALMVVAVLAVSVVELSPYWPLPATLDTAKWALYGGSNIGILRTHFDYFTPHTYNPLLHTWSLGVEEQFYLFFGLLFGACVWLARRLRRRPEKFVAVAVVGVLLVSLAACILSATHGHWLISAPFYNPLDRAWEFAAGALIAAVWRRPLANPYVAWLGTAGMVASVALITPAAHHPGWVTLAPVLATVALILGAVEDAGVVGRVLRTRVAGWIGDRSYAIYLWHWPFIVLTQAAGGGRLAVVCAAAASVPMAALTYRFWEDPIRRYKFQRGQFRLPKALVAPVVCLLVGFGAVHAGTVAMRHIDTGALHDFAVRTTSVGFKSAECESPIPVPARNLAPCTFAGISGKRQIILLGDSNAGQYNAAVTAAGAKLGRTVVLATMPGCALVLIEPPVDPACQNANLATLQWLAKQPPSIVIVSSANWVGANLADAWASGMRETYARIQAQGHLVVHVMSLPHFATADGKWLPYNCAFLAVHRDPDRCGRTSRIGALEDVWSPGLSAELAGAADVRRLDLDGIVCPEGVCRTNVGNRWIFRDGTHISEDESERLTPYFVKTLRDLP